MPKFIVHHETTSSIVIKVEADNYEDAIEKAWEILPSSVCAQCSGWNEKWSRDEGEYEATAVEDEAGNMVWEENPSNGSSQCNDNEAQDEVQATQPKPE